MIKVPAGQHIDRAPGGSKGESMKKQLRAGAVAGLSIAVFGTLAAVPTQAVAAGKAKNVYVKFDCKVHTVSDRFGKTEYKGCKKNGKYKASLRTQDTKRDGWSSTASLKRGSNTILTVVADGKGKWSAWKSTPWTGKRTYVVSP